MFMIPDRNKFICLKIHTVVYLVDNLLAFCLHGVSCSVLSRSNPITLSFNVQDPSAKLIIYPIALHS